jgi:hypothetical protein
MAFREPGKHVYSRQIKHYTLDLSLQFSPSQPAKAHEVMKECITRAFRIISTTIIYRKEKRKKKKKSKMDKFFSPHFGLFG